MEQLTMPLLQRLEGPAVVPPSALSRARTYREAVRLCWQLRRIKWTPAALAMAYSFTRQHISDWLNPDDKPTRRSLPAEHITGFEDAMGNTFITQWLTARQRLTVLEEVQAGRLAA